MASKLSIGRTISESYGFALRAAVPSLPRLLLFAGGMVAYETSMQVKIGSLMLDLAFQFGGLLAAFATGILLSASLYRRALKIDRKSTLASDSWRLALANLSVYILSAVLLFILIVFFSVLAGILIGTSGHDPETAGDPSEIVNSLAALSETGGGLVLYALLFAILISLIWLALRLVLFGIATVARAEITIFRSWSWTKGHAGRIFAISLISVMLPYLVCMLVYSAFAAPFGYPSLLSALRLDGAAPGTMQDQIFQAIASVLIFAPTYLIGHGMAASVYRQIGPQGVDVDATFG